MLDEAKKDPVRFLQEKIYVKLFRIFIPNEL